MKPSVTHERFTALVDEILSVPHAEIVRRERGYKAQATLNPKKRGPKPKRKSGAAPAAGVVG
ncbi:MAG TPA: hypothetical protein VMV31_08550 [Terriglobales bacterium]|nr:hypothetical protein [Terriglobales bacterium]